MILIFYNPDMHKYQHDIHKYQHDSIKSRLNHNSIVSINVDTIYYYNKFSNKNYVENYFGENLF